ncbi:hypothetical protein GOP47_0014373 [Adiantum capillus-veneris]|uniref:Uncharacterized protein n=1 Tax=Adiantum capillus-veneris TaxID=13818 RepID=A0A9D4ZE36_ADICA|nr:hypothetical protein GOP47_0014373 [Adiantum capillus-veneris]
MDSHRASIKLQDDVMRVLFQGLGSVSEGNEKCLAKLLAEKSNDWNGSLNDFKTPSNFSGILKLYKDKGMVIPQEWKLCLGSESHPHEPQVFPPSKEDADRDTSMCVCIDGVRSRHRERDFLVCCERCSKCSKSRKEMMPFLYTSLIDQLRCLCQSEEYCHDFLSMWRARERWLGKEPSQHPEFMQEVWDGEKMRIYHDFWNPGAFWEAPVVCQNDKCKMTYRAFPKCLSSKELIRS